MTFLELCKRVLQESGLSGTGPASVIGQRGIEARIVNWVRDAWIDIQQDREDWSFMYKRISFNLSPGKSDYSLVEMGISDLSRWEFGAATVYETASGPGVTRPLYSDVDHDTWLLSLGMGETVQSDRVTRVLIIPGTNNSLKFWPPPLEETTVGLTYFKTPVSLAANEDIPDLWPESLQMVIVWRALIDYAFYDGAAEIEARAREKYEELMLKIDGRKKPTVNLMGATLA